VVRRALIGVALAAVVSIVLFALSTSRHAVNANAAKLQTADAELTDMHHRLDAAGAAYDIALAQQHVAQVRLEQREVQRDVSSSRLQAVQRQLHQQQTVLSQTAADLARRFARLGYLNQCLAGASKALNEASVSDYNGLAATLQSVQSQCIAAKSTS
jgi:hypothetical protein